MITKHVPSLFWGERGEQGPQGDPGGPQGPQGDPGPSAYDVAVDEGFLGTVEDWLDSLVGPQGAQGDPGADGADGADGSNGTNGTDGATILSGSLAPDNGDGNDGDFYVRTNGDIYKKVVGVWGSPLFNTTGPAGSDGSDGANGADGADGDTGPQGSTGPAPASTGFKFVTVEDSVLADPATTGFGSGSGDVCEGDDPRLSDDRDPNAHAATHADGGGDDVDITTLAGYSGDGDDVLHGDGSWSPPTGGSWALVGSCMDTGTTATGSWDFTSNVSQVRFNNLGGYSELLIITVGITKATTGLTSLTISIDNGSNFLTASGDYIIVSADGAESNTTAVSMHSTNATAARSTLLTVHNWNKTDGVSRWIFRNNLSSNTNSSYRVPTTSAVDAIRIFPSAGGNITAGKIRIYGR